MTLHKIQAFLWRNLPLVVLIAGAAVAVPLARCQTVSLSRSGSGAVPAGTSAKLNVVLSGTGGGVFALQWNIAADAPGTVISGASLTPATLTQGASVACSPSGNICLIYNLTGTVALPDAAIATLTVTVPQGVSSVTVALSNAIASDATGNAVPLLGPAVTIPVSSGSSTPPSFGSSGDFGQFPPAGTVATPSFDPQGGNFVALKVICGGCQPGTSSVNGVTFGSQPMTRSALLSANGILDVWTLTGSAALAAGTFTLVTDGIANLQLQAYSAKNVASLVVSTNLVNLGNAMATTTVMASAGDLLAVFTNGVRPYSSDTGTVRQTGIVDQVAVAGVNTIHTEVDFQGPNYANAIVVLDLKPAAGLAGGFPPAPAVCTSQHLVPVPANALLTPYTGPGINQDGDAVAMTPWTAVRDGLTVQCLAYLRKSGSMMFAWTGEQCCFG